MEVKVILGHSWQFVCLFCFIAFFSSYLTCERVAGQVHGAGGRLGHHANEPLAHPLEEALDPPLACPAVWVGHLMCE